MRNRRAFPNLEIICACLWALATAHAQEPTTTKTIQRPQRESTAPELIIATKTVPAHDVVYIEHEGPYWRLGPLFRQVDQARRRFDKDAPMYARFCAPPLDPRAAKCTTEVGFITNGAPAAGPAFHTAHRDHELVAFTVIPSRVSSTRRHYDPILKWIAENGFTATGPVMEIHLPPDKDRPIATPRMEIQVAIVPATEAPTTKAAEPTNVEPVTPKEAVPTATEPPPSQARAETATPPGEAAPTSTEPQAQTPDHGAEATTTPAPERSTAPPEPFRPIPELVKEKDWDRIARQIMPDDLDIPAATQLWFGQLVFRIGALGKGLNMQNADTDLDAVALAQAITRRYDVVSSRFTTDPLAEAVVRVDPRDREADVKRTITRDLDALLAKVALRNLNPSEALADLSAILQRTYDAVHVEKP